MVRTLVVSSVGVVLLAGCGSSAQKGEHGVAPAVAARPAEAGSVKALSPGEFEKVLKEHPDYVVLDVRRPEEYATGHLPGARLMSVESAEFEKEMARLDPGKTYLTYCRTGRRSAVACEKLEAKGLKASQLEGGITAWRAANLPVEK